MGELITLSCPSCGGKLEVNEFASVLICHHCRNAHLVNRVGGVLELEAYARCPKCERNDRAEKVTSILRRSPDESALTNILSPPPTPLLKPKSQKPPKPEKTKRTVIDPKSVTGLEKGKTILLILSFLLLLPFCFCLTGSIALLSEGVIDGFIAFLVAALFPLLGAVVFMVIRSNKIRKDKATIQAMQESADQAWEEENKEILQKWGDNHQIKLNLWEQENTKLEQEWKAKYAVWEKLYYCHRDDCVFLPGKRTYAPVEKINTLLSQEIEQDQHQENNEDRDEVAITNRPLQPESIEDNESTAERGEIVSNLALPDDVNDFNKDHQEKTEEKVVITPIVFPIEKATEPNNNLDVEGEQERFIKELDELDPSEQELESEKFAGDIQKHQMIDHSELSISEQIDDKQDFSDVDEEITSGIIVLDQRAQTSDILDQDPQASGYVDPSEQLRSKRKRTPTNKPRVDEPWSPGSYYQRFKDQRNFFKELSDDEVDEFIAKLAHFDIDEILEWSLLEIENHIFESLKRVQLIGELPISHAAFNQLCQYNQDIRVRRTDGRLSRYKTIPPAYFMIMMVFCARYSEEDARNFWRPYSQLVWGSDEADISFQNVCRDHFRASRLDLEEAIGLRFKTYTEGDVVLPVYQHAIIPYHLMEHMANWIVENFDLFLKFDPQQLQHLISDKESLRYLPHQLQRYLTDEETSQAAAALLDKMADAIEIFKEKGSETLVETLIESPIEKSLWQAIYSQLMVDISRVERIRRVQPKLDWVWMMEEEDLGLCLSGVQSPPEQKPNTLYVTSNCNFKTSSYQPSLSPYFDIDRGWELDKICILSEKLIDTDEIYVVSDQFDLDLSPEVQQASVLFVERIPTIEENCVFFRLGLNQKNAREKDTIDSGGDWVILSKSDFELRHMNGESLPYSAYNIPQFLRNYGFNHIRKYDLTLPIRMVCDEMETQIEVRDGRRYLEPLISGDQPVDGLSAAVPPAFQSQDVFVTFDLDPQYPLRRTYFSISNSKAGFTTLSLGELKRNGQLSETDHGIRIALDEFLGEFGQYQVDIIHGLRSLLDEPIVFSCFTDIKISPLKIDRVFSPKRPFQVEISGVAEEMLDYPEDAKAILAGEPKLLRWKLHKATECSFSINDGHGGHVKLLWEIDRVTAWVDGGFNKNLIEAGQETKAGLNVRGKPFQDFQWIINDETVSPGKLDVRGEFSNILRDTQIRDLLRETNTSLSKVEIEIDDMRWQIFQYMKKPRVGVLEISYKHKALKFKLSLSRILRGQYQLQIKKKGALAAPVAFCDMEELTLENSWNVELGRGDFVLEIYLDNELLTTSPIFSHRRRFPIAQTQREAPQEVAEELTAETLYSILTADQLDLKEYKKINWAKNPYLEQLLCINDQSTWYVDGNVEAGIKQLLPFWAVTKHPFRFIERKFHKPLIIYPAETALGGIVGRGYTDLKVNNNKVMVYAAWKPDSTTNYVKLFLCFPKVNVHPKLFRLDRLAEWYLEHLRPAYQCVDCGELLGTGEEGFPPHIFNQHLHGGQRFSEDQFIDTRRQESLDNTLSVFEDEILDFRGSVEDSIIRNCAELFKMYSSIKKYGELSKPIVTANNLDYGKAFTELFDNNKLIDNKDSINFFMDQKVFFDQLDHHLNSLSGEIVALSAMKRLSDSLSDDDPLCETPKFALSLCMLLRLKAHYEHVYSSFLDDQQISENQLRAMLNAAMNGFPKLLEWSIAWAEIFYVHAIS